MTEPDQRDRWPRSLHPAQMEHARRLGGVHVHPIERRFDMSQMTLDDALAAGDRGMSIALINTEAVAPSFSEKAAAAILAHLRAVGQASGEVLTDVARLHGAVPRDDRAFGAVFKSLSKKGLIRHVGFCLRTKGNGTAGGRIWGVV